MTKKPAATDKQPAEKPLTIIVTVLPPKRGSRLMIVSAAREGEMPLILGGAFADRYHLLDQAYATVMKRDPQVVTVKEETPKHRQSKFVNGKLRKDEDEEEAVKREPDEDPEKSDQLVGEDGPSPQPSPLKGEGEELPAIEGDEVAPEDAAVGEFEAQLSDISSPEEPDAEEAKSGEEVDDDR